ncbi:hypothetical protein BKA62DRAFT_128918 [Auriculariales sp. MPI-PUGE-AT-0066]|nr:hypothetical protein BKA62DRAFT_128918 [Auriculariales sp. MPI-PUGE-AT-0066]
MVTTKTPLTIKYPSHTVHETASGGGNYSPSDSTSGQDSDDDSPSVETPKDLLEFADIDVKLSATTLLGANTVRNFSSLISGQKLYEHPVGSRHGAGNLSSPSRRHEHAHDLSSFGNDDFGGRSFAFTFSQPYARENKDAPTTSTASTISEPSRPHSALGYHSEAGLDIAAPPHRRRPSLSASFTFTEHLRGDSTACFEDAESRLASDEMSVSLDSKPSPATLERLPQTPPMRQFEPAVPSTPRVCRVAKDPFPESVTNINYANLNGENENVTSEQDDLAIQDDAVQKGRYISVGYFEADEDDLPPTTSHVNQVRDHDEW